jgi:microcystin-dependent protein
MASAFPGGIDSLPDITNPTTTDCNVPPTLSSRINLLQEAMTAVETWLLANSPAWTPPPGLIMAFAGTSAPPGYVMCDGSSYSTTTFAALFNVIGTTYGSGVGTFAVPDLRGKVVVGAISAFSPSFPLGTTGGEYTHQLSLTELASHTHSVTSPNHTHSATDSGHTHTVTNAFNQTIQGLQTGGATYFLPAQISTGVGNANITVGASSAGITTTNSNGSNTPHNNIQPYLSLNYVIKT